MTNHFRHTTYTSNNTPQAYRRCSIPGGYFFLGSFSKLRFDKLPTTIDQQLELLIARGMNVGDIDVAKNWLKTVGYYRLSAYWLPFEAPPEHDKVRSKTFKPETTLQSVTDLYVFDRKLRLLVLEGIERVEVHIRSRWTYHMSHKHGAHAHLNLDQSLFSNNFNQLNQLSRLEKSVKNSQEIFIKHYNKKYDTPLLPPLWAITELMSLGELSKWYQATKDNKVKSAVGNDLGLQTIEVVVGVLQVLSYVRNICAHHSRLWNRKTVKRLPLIRKLEKNLVIIEDKASNKSCDNSLYNLLSVLLYLIDQQKTDSSFRLRLRKLIEKETSWHQNEMGFPQDWQAREIWK